MVRKSKSVQMTQVKNSLKKGAKKLVNAARKDPRSRSLVKGGMRRVGGMAGTLLGGPAGGAIGLQTADFISRITGFGDYKVNKNTIVQGNSVPTFRSGGDGMTVCHREFIEDVSGSIGFASKTYSLNPGIKQTFPLLSLLAQTFEEYELRGLVFEYRPSSGSAVSSTSSALGIVVLATNYDAADPPFTNKQEMESYEFSTSTVPFSGCIHPVECMRKRNVLDNLYVRTGPVPADTDIRFYDMGKFTVATQGMQSAYTVGEIWVSYDCVFRKPRLPPVVSPLPPSSQFAFWFGTNKFGDQSSTGQTFGPSIDTPVVLSGSGDFVSMSDGLITLPQKGKYVVCAHLRTSTEITTSLQHLLGPNLVAGNPIFISGTSTSVQNINAPGEGHFFNSFTVSNLSGLTSGVGIDFSLSVPYGSSAVMSILVVKTADVQMSPFAYMFPQRNRKGSLDSTFDFAEMKECV